MRLVISNYLRTLRERGEFDELLPDLLNAMDIVPLSRPSVGTRQFGVDMAAVGPDPDANGERKLFLFVLKQGDITRPMWGSDSPQSVRPTLEEVLDVYLRAHIPQGVEALPKKIILSTTGEMKEEVVPNWSGFTKFNESRAEFDFWGADKVAGLIQKNLLNENIFGSIDRDDFRRALSLVSEPDYNLEDFHNIILRQLGLNSEGEVEKIFNTKELGNALLRVNLATRILAGWSMSEGNTKRALLVTERALLWSWYRLNFEGRATIRTLSRQIDAIWQGYSDTSRALLDAFRAHSKVRDGLSGYTSEPRIFALIVFEILGILASIGLAHLYTMADKDGAHAEMARDATQILVGIIENNSIVNSPQYDEHVVEICLTMSLLIVFGETGTAEQWLRKIVSQYTYTMTVRRNFPISTDSFDDLVEARHGEIDNEAFQKLTNASWLLPTLAGWAVNLQDERSYNALIAGIPNAFKGVTGQLWHPLRSELMQLYFRSFHHQGGEAEAPIVLPDTLEEHRKVMKELLEIERLAFVGKTSAFIKGRFGLDFVAFRHFRTPVPANYWYEFADEGRFFQPYG